jgi:hypothetical protein
VIFTPGSGEIVYVWFIVSTHTLLGVAFSYVNGAGVTPTSLLDALATPDNNRVKKINNKRKGFT